MSRVRLCSVSTEPGAQLFRPGQECYAGDRDIYADIDYAARMTYRYYGQLFTDVLELGDGWSERLDIKDSRHNGARLCFRHAMPQDLLLLPW